MSSYLTGALNYLNTTAQYYLWGSNETTEETPLIRTIDNPNPVPTLPNENPPAQNDTDQDTVGSSEKETRSNLFDNIKNRTIEVLGNSRAEQRNTVYNDTNQPNERTSDCAEFAAMIALTVVGMCVVGGGIKGSCYCIETTDNQHLKTFCTITLFFFGTIAATAAFTFFVKTGSFPCM